MRAFDRDLPHLAYPLAVDFANSVGPTGSSLPGDLFESASGVARWLAHERHALGDLEMLRPKVADLRRLRSIVDAVLRASAKGESMPTAAVGALNRISERAPHHSVLRLDQDPPDAQETSLAPDASSELEARVARSCIELVGGRERWRLRTCSAPSCGLLFVASRDSQSWCSSSCGNRARVARHHQKRRAG